MRTVIKTLKNNHVYLILGKNSTLDAVGNLTQLLPKFSHLYIFALTNRGVVLISQPNKGKKIFSPFVDTSSLINKLDGAFLLDYLTFLVTQDNEVINTIYNTDKTVLVDFFRSFNIEVDFDNLKYSNDIKEGTFDSLEDFLIQIMNDYNEYYELKNS